MPPCLVPFNCTFSVCLRSAAAKGIRGIPLALSTSTSLVPEGVMARDGRLSSKVVVSTDLFVAGVKSYSQGWIDGGGFGIVHSPRSPDNVVQLMPR